MKSSEIFSISRSIGLKPNLPILIPLRQPLTAKQLSIRTGKSIDQSIYLLSKLAEQGLVQCLNPNARRSRLYWLTELGKRCQKQSRKQVDLPLPSDDLPEIDWDLYGNVCFSHRATVIRTLTEPMQPVQIKKRALRKNSKLRMSANNVRDVIQFFKKHDLVQPVKLRKKVHPLYELTGKGRHFRRLLLQAEVGE